MNLTNVLDLGVNGYSHLDLKNNIVVNQSVSTNRNYVIGLRWQGTYPRLYSNNNDFYASGSHFAVVGGLDNSPAGDRTTLAAWQTETGTDGNSKNVLPEFNSSTNLHLNTSGSNNLANLIGFGTPVSVTTDIDCETRYSNPDIGADENCISPTVPTLSATNTSICLGASTTLSLASGNLNKALNWQWYSGSCGGTPVGSGTSVSVSPTVTTTYYVRGEGGCVTPGSCGSITITVNSVTPTISGAITICQGSAITLDAGAGYASYSWSDGGGSAQTATFTNITNSTTYTVVVTDGNGCTGSDTHSITVNSLPIPSITGPAAICSGSDVTLDAGPGFSQYAWSDGGGNAQSATYNAVMVATTYTVTVTDANNCTASDTHAITLYTPPAPSVTGPSTVCPGNNAILDAGAGFASYSWSDGGGNAQTATYSVLLSTTYTVVVTDGNGCTGSDTHTVNVYTNPAPTITGPAGVCSGGNVTLDAGTGYAAYVWSDGGGSAQTATFTNITMSTTYQVTVTDANGCMGTDAHLVSVSTGLNPVITGPTSVCPGSNVTLDAGAGYATYAWSDGGGSGQTATYTGLAMATTYTVTVADAFGCTGSDTHTVNVGGSALTPVITGPSAVCNGSNVTLDAGAGYATYAWSDGGGSGQTATYSGLTTATTYTVTVSDGSGCTGSDTHTVSINSNPVPVIAGPTSVCSGGSVTLDAGAGYAGYAWSNSGGSAQTATFSNVTLATIYEVTVTDANGCAGSDVHAVSVNALPVVSISGPSGVCSGGNVTLDAGAGFTAYTWSNGGGVGQTATFNNITTTTTYAVTVTGTNGCANTATRTIAAWTCSDFSGKIIWEGDRQTTMTGVNLTTVKLTGGDTDQDITGVAGTYSLTSTMGSSFTITPTKKRPMPHAMNGVDAADASRIQQHVLGVSLLTDPYKIIAADVNKSNSISSADGGLIQQAILGNVTAQNWFANNTWRFVPKSYVFPQQNIPWGFPEKITLTGAGNYTNQDFIGVKLGDVNTTANPVNKPGSIAPNLVWKVQDQWLAEGATYTIEFRADHFDNLMALQFGFQFDPALLEFTGLETIEGSLMQAGNFGLFAVNTGEIKALLALTEGRTFENGTSFFRLKFKALKENIRISDALHLSNDVLLCAAYSPDYTPGTVDLIYETVETTGTTHLSGDQFKLMQNIPNPVTSHTTIGFYLPEAATAHMRLFDVNGKLIMEQSGRFEKGYNKMEFDLGSITSDGVVHYELIAPFGTLSRKLVVTKQ